MARRADARGVRRAAIAAPEFRGGAQRKAPADPMQHMVPLKEKQIQQLRLEAEARKESTVKNAEAMALKGMQSVPTTPH
jgi:hypothetical protein